MVFSSQIFLFYFLPITLGLYYLMHWRRVDIRWMNLFITVASYLFYGWFEPWFVILMWVSTVLDYTCGRVISGPGTTILRRNVALGASLVGNLGLLAFFKYYMFTMGGINHILMQLGLGPSYFHIFAVTLPIGISFYTFNTLSYVIDVWRGDAPPVRDLRSFMLFVSLFPHLVAGPIIRYNTVAHQLDRRHHSLLRFSSGVVLFSIGMAKKIMLANPAGQVADGCFGADHPGFWLSWWGVLAYALQIYFDFSGYSDMAVGLGRMIGIEITRNFNDPYQSKSMTDFWKRWHMSLTTWFTDYLYITLGGNRVKTKRRLYFNLFLVMFISGVWHGANWTFICWGLFHAFFLISERMMDRKPLYEPLPVWAKVVLTNLIVLFAWVLFRAPTLTDALFYWQNMIGMHGASISAVLLHPVVFQPYLVFSMVLAIVCTQMRWQAHDFSAYLTWPRLVFGFAMFLISMLAMFTQAFNPFLYFQF